MTKKMSNDDLTNLSILDENMVLKELKSRYSNNKIYTYIGDILIAVNPLKQIEIYGKVVSDQYKACIDNIRINLSPHVFATAEQCYREMLRTQQSQCILISGESGSGKTETCKHIVEHLLNRTKKFEICLNEKIQEVNPVLEAFGNAKTRINDNSSRFGKFLDIHFQEDGSVIGAKFKEYLLEKSRIVYQNSKESTFHIFYYLVGDLLSNEYYGHKLHEIKHRYIANSLDITHSDYNNIAYNKKQFDAIMRKMATIGFSNEDIKCVRQILFSILLIGDIEFTQHSQGDGVVVSNMSLIDTISELLDLQPELLHDALISDLQFTRGEEIRRERNMIQACDVRDAFAKALYGRLFSWIVNHINHHIQPMDGMYSIGLMDIFGFENFENNSFEQMCINLANEQLHQLFTKYIFKLEIEECLEENIEISDFLSYQDNQIILDLFLDKRNSIFSIFDEVNRFPQANDDSLAIKLHQSLTSLYPDVYKPPKNGGRSFSIQHYAGQVSYNMDGFIEMNRDFLPNNLIALARESNSFLMQELFKCKLTRKGTIAPSDRQAKLRKNQTKPFDTKCMQLATDYQQASFKRTSFVGRQSCADEKNLSLSINDRTVPLTVTSHFKNSLSELIEKIGTCKPYFIRCIKPNSKQDTTFVDSFVIKQLRYCSIIYLCKIRKSGFPYRIQFDDFLKWYKPIEICKVEKSCTDNCWNTIERCIRCLNHAKLMDCKIGKSKIFLRYGHLDILNQMSKTLVQQVVITQKVVRGWLARKTYQKLKSNANEILENKKKHENLTANNIGAKFKVLSNLNVFTKNMPDMKEIDSTLQQLDDMLEKYEIDTVNYKENKKFDKYVKISPSAVYHLVHNNNNKNDNTLKRKNALVAFEFKKIMSTAHNDSNSKASIPTVPYPSLTSSNELGHANQMSNKNHLQNDGNSWMSNSSPNITIWREELNSKANMQYKIKKEIEFVQKLEESKSQIPEWKRNLIKQKEIRKATHTSVSTSLIDSATTSHGVLQQYACLKEETPELMKHNIFIKKGLATSS